MKLFLLLCFILLFPFQLDARSQASGRTQASNRSSVFSIIAVDNFDRAPSLGLGADWTEIEDDPDTFQIKAGNLLFMGEEFGGHEHYGVATWNPLNINTIPPNISIEMVFNEITTNNAFGQFEPRAMALRIDPACVLASCSYYSLIPDVAQTNFQRLRIIKMINQLFTNFL